MDDPRSPKTLQAGLVLASASSLAAASFASLGPDFVWLSRPYVHAVLLGLFVGCFGYMFFRRTRAGGAVLACTVAAVAAVSLHPQLQLLLYAEPAGNPSFGPMAVCALVGSPGVIMVAIDQRRPRL